MQPLLPPQATAGVMPPQAQAGMGAMPPQAQAGMGVMPPQAAAGVGVSPDGIGSFIAQPGGQRIDQSSTTRYWPEMQMQGELPFLEPRDTSGQATLQSAGFTALFVALTTGIGLAWGKGWGAVAGLTIGAGLMNAYRAQKWMNDPDPGRRHEAIVSATVTVGEAIVAGYAIFKANQARKGS
jgi:hypothetical protein